jgi:membrane-associated phospholipid phosphatase
MLSIVAYSREIQIIIFLAGQVADECLNQVLKAVIKEHRPDSIKQTNYFVHFNLVFFVTERIKHGDHDYGMPSAHSQFSFFFATYFTLFLVLKYKSFSSRGHRLTASL